MIVAGQGTQAVQDLVEEIFGMELLHDLPIDPITDAQHTFSIHVLDGLRSDGGNPPEQVTVVSLEGAAGPHERQRRPGASSPPHRSNQQVVFPRRMLVSNEASQEIEVPVAVLRDRKQQLSAGSTVTGDSDASVRCLQYFA